jgi:F-type H+-transporting ATPase subunit delta
MSEKQTRAGRYAQAVLQAMLERWDASLSQTESALKADPDLASLLADKKKSADQKQAAMAKALPADTPAEIYNLLLLMGQEEDLELLPEVISALSETVSGQRAPIKAEIVSAAELSDDDKDQLRRKLTSQYGEGLIFSFRVDPSLMGGLRVRVGDHLIDTSVASRLATLRESLTSAVR